MKSQDGFGFGNWLMKLWIIGLIGNKDKEGSISCICAFILEILVELTRESTWVTFITDI